MSLFDMEFEDLSFVKSKSSQSREKGVIMEVVFVSEIVKDQSSVRKALKKNNYLKDPRFFI